jgi:NADPH-dependent ferric siderophore reductase
MHVPVHDGWYLFSSSGSGARHSQGLAPVATPRCCYATRTPVPAAASPASASRRRLADRLLLHTPVLAVDQIAARMTRIRLDLADLATPAWIPGQQVRVVVGDVPAPKDWILGQMRTYSIWEATPDRLDLAVLDHGDGPGAEWARHARPGQLAAFTRPQGTLTARPSGSHLLIGEETAAVAFGAILRALPAGQHALTIIEADGPGDQLPLPGDVHWHYRHGRSAPAPPPYCVPCATPTCPALAQTRRHHQAVLDPGKKGME